MAHLRQPEIVQRKCLRDRTLIPTSVTIYGQAILKLNWSKSYLVVKSLKNSYSLSLLVVKVLKNRCLDDASSLKKRPCDASTQVQMTHGPPLGSANKGFMVAGGGGWPRPPAVLLFYTALCGSVMPTGQKNMKKWTYCGRITSRHWRTNQFYVCTVTPILLPSWPICTVSHPLFALSPLSLCSHRMALPDVLCIVLFTDRAENFGRLVGFLMTRQF
jgi:hypothetical protein